MGKEERTIILTFLHVMYFWERFIDDVFFIFLGSHSQLNSLMTFMNRISAIIKYTFNYAEQTVTFLDVQIYLSKTRKRKMKLYRKPTDCMTLLLFHSHHPLSSKGGIIYSPHYHSFCRHGQTTLSHHTQKLAHCCQRHHTLHHLAIQTLISLYQIQQYSYLPCSLCTNIWLLTARLLAPLPTRTHIRQFGHAHNDIPMAI